MPIPSRRRVRIGTAAPAAADSAVAAPGSGRRTALVGLDEGLIGGDGSFRSGPPGFGSTTPEAARSVCSVSRTLEPCPNPGVHAMDRTVQRPIMGAEHTPTLFVRTEIYSPEKIRRIHRTVRHPGPCDFVSQPGQPVAPFSEGSMGD